MTMRSLIVGAALAALVAAPAAFAQSAGGAGAAAAGGSTSAGGMTGAVGVGSTALPGTIATQPGNTATQPSNVPGQPSATPGMTDINGGQVGANAASNNGVPSSATRTPKHNSAKHPMSGSADGSSLGTMGDPSAKPAGGAAMPNPTPMSH